MGSAGAAPTEDARTHGARGADVVGAACALPNPAPTEARGGVDARPAHRKYGSQPPLTVTTAPAPRPQRSGSYIAPTSTGGRVNTPPVVARSA